MRQPGGMARWMRAVLVLLACAVAGVGSGRALVAVRASAGPPELAHGTTNGLVELAGVGPGNPTVLDVSGCAGSVACGYVAAKAALGQADLRGLIATRDLSQCDDGGACAATLDQALQDVRGYAGALAAYGLGHLPEVTPGADGPLVRPPHGDLRDTEYARSLGSDLIVAQARAASPERPLLVLTAWPGTTVAAAYLSDPGIAGSVVVAMAGTQPGRDPWAAEVVRRGFRTILADQPGGPRTDPGIRGRIEHELPPGEFRDALLANPAIAAGDTVGDAAFALYLHRPYTWRAVEERDRGVLALTAFDVPEARNEWFATIANPALHGGRPLALQGPSPGPTPTQARRFRANIDFGPADAPVADGYERDAGEVYGDRGNGLSYGWDQSVAADMRARGRVEDVRYDTLAHFAKNGDRTWEIAVPPGSYEVRMALGDPAHTDQLNHMDVEGAIVQDGIADAWDVHSVIVDVSDGRLTLRPAPGSYNAKISFVKITQR